MIALAIGQAGLASGMLTRAPALNEFHGIVGFITLAVCVLTAVLGAIYVRDGGPRWVLGLTAATAIVAAAQVGLGEAEVKDAHMFLGTLFAMLATALVSWVFRHRHEPVAN